MLQYRRRVAEEFERLVAAPASAVTIHREMTQLSI
jgi:hypothetical protein